MHTCVGMIGSSAWFLLFSPSLLYHPIPRVFEDETLRPGVGPGEWRGNLQNSRRWTCRVTKRRAWPWMGLLMWNVALRCNTVWIYIMKTCLLDQLLPRGHPQEFQPGVHGSTWALFDKASGQPLWTLWCDWALPRILTMMKTASLLAPLIEISLAKILQGEAFAQIFPLEGFMG